MSTIDTIVSRAKTDAKYYTALATDFEKTISSYRLSRREIEDLKTKLKAIKPPEGIRGYPGNDW